MSTREKILMKLIMISSNSRLLLVFRECMLNCFPIVDRLEDVSRRTEPSYFRCSGTQPIVETCLEQHGKTCGKGCCTRVMIIVSIKYSLYYECSCEASHPVTTSFRSWSRAV